MNTFQTAKISLFILSHGLSFLSLVPSCFYFTKIPAGILPLKDFLCVTKSRWEIVTSPSIKPINRKKSWLRDQTGRQFTDLRSPTKDSRESFHSWQQITDRDKVVAAFLQHLIHVAITHVILNWVTLVTTIAIVFRVGPFYPISCYTTDKRTKIIVVICKPYQIFSLHVSFVILYFTFIRIAGLDLLTSLLEIVLTIYRML